MSHCNIKAKMFLLCCHNAFTIIIPSELFELWRHILILILIRMYYKHNVCYFTFKIILEVLRTIIIWTYYYDIMLYYMYDLNSCIIYA